MNCSLCNASISKDSTSCLCCGASCETPQGPKPVDDPLEECLPVGSSLHHGHYRIGRVLGHGGFGVTYQGSDIPMQLPVAIKEFFPLGCARRGLNLMPGRKIPSQEYVEQRVRFLEEARVLARLNHTGIVRVHTAFEENNTAYMVMEYVRGKTLEALINERGRLNEEEVLGYVHKLAEALEVMHGQGEEGILHRDIKPANIMVTPEGRVVLIDFGTARQFAANVSRAMSQTLTPGYAPLEQYSARARYGPPLDIYALGATMYHALTGQVPLEALERSQGVDLKPPHHLCPSVSRRTSDAVVAALEMSAARRPQSIAYLLRSLKGGAMPTNAPMPAPGPPQCAANPVVKPKISPPATPKVASPPSALMPAGVRPLATNAQGFQEFRNEKDGTVLIRIPSGTFQMGSNEQDCEKPIHAVTLPPFLMARVPVTNAQFARFISATGFDAGTEWKIYALRWGDQAPVVCVNWNDATAYCAWAGLRLPTEAEWEFAARGPQSLVYPWGNAWDQSRCQNSVGGNPDRAAPVGSFPSGASPFGCLDMAGNVWEWTGSWYDRYPGSTHLDSRFGQKHLVLRGGAWDFYDPSNFRGASRYWINSGTRYSYYGCSFRCAKTL